MSEQPERIYFYSIIPDTYMYYSPIFREDNTSMTNEHDTHFMGAAELLLQKLEQLRLSRAEQKTLITQFLYDFFYHVMDHAQDEVYYPPEQWLGHVPDLTEWPERGEQ